MNRDTKKNKELALKTFTDKLLNQGVKDLIAKAILFGSFAKGESRPESDIDLVIVGINNVKEIEQACDKTSFEVAQDFGESIEPLVYCIDEYLFPPTYFLYNVIKHGKEVYSMNESILKKKEAENFYQLAQEYILGAEAAYKDKFFRLCIDAAYNAGELSVKGLLLLKIDDIPGSHGGIVGKFGETYIKSKVLSQELGRGLNRALRLRNKARYDWHAEITNKDAKEILSLAKKLLKILEEKIR